VKTQHQEVYRPVLIRAANARASLGEVIELCRDTLNETRSLLTLLDQILAKSKAAAIDRRSDA
jgi:hypothetical protein